MTSALPRLRPFRDAVRFAARHCLGALIWVVSCAALLFAPAAHAQIPAKRVLIAATNESYADYQANLIAEFTNNAPAGSTIITNQTETTNGQAPSPGFYAGYDLVIVTSVFAALDSADFTALQNAILSKESNAFVFLTDFCDGCANSNKTAMMTLLNAVKNPATLPNPITVGIPSSTCNGNGANLNTASPYSASFNPILATLPTCYYSPINGLPNNNRLYVNHALPATGADNEAFGIVLPVVDSRGAGVFVVTDIDPISASRVGYLGYEAIKNKFAPAFFAATSTGGSMFVGIPETDLALAASVSPSTAHVNEQVVYSFTVTNNSTTTTATNVKVEDLLPTGDLTVVSSTGACTQASPATPICTIASIAPGASASYSLTATVKTGAAPRTIDANPLVIAGATQVDPTSANNTTKVSLSVAINTPPVADVIFSGAVQDIAGKGALVTVYDTTTKPHPTSGATNVDFGPTNTTSTFGNTGGESFWNWSSTSSYGGGLTIDVPVSEFPNSKTYSMGMRFSFAQTNGYRKVVDFLDRSADNGFYIHNSQVNFFTTTSQGDQGTFNANTVYNFLIVRDEATQTFKVYLASGGGTTPIYTLTNITADVAQPTTVAGGFMRFRFFHDDIAFLDGASNAGKVYSIKIWNRALGDAELNNPDLLDAPPDTTAPTLDGPNSVPVHNSSASVTGGLQMVIAFSENVKFSNAGTITLYDLTATAPTPKVVETFTVLNGLASGSLGGTASITGNKLTLRTGLAGGFAPSTSYRVDFSDGALTDTASTPNLLSGVNNAAGYTFTTTQQDGVCGTAAGGTTVGTAPTANLCSVGTPSIVTTGNTQYDWSCAGIGPSTQTRACFVYRHYLVTPSITGTNGTVTPSVATKVNYNDQQLLNFSPASGYAVAVGGTCGGTLAGTVYTTKPVTQHCTVEGTFRLAAQCNATTTAGTFTTEPTSGALCTAGTASAVTPGNTSYAWTCSGGSATANCSASRKYLVTPVGSGLSFSPATAQTVNYNDSPSFIVTPGTGFVLQSVTGCNGSLSGDVYAAGPVTASCSITGNASSTTSPAVKTGQTTVALAQDDGTYQSGKARNFVRYAGSPDKGVVAHPAVALEWQDNVAPPSHNHSSALAYCAGLNLEGTRWRLPNVHELSLLYHHGVATPRMDTPFQNKLAGAFWADKPDQVDATKAWTMDFTTGALATADTNSTLSTRCVRDFRQTLSSAPANQEVAASATYTSPVLTISPALVGDNFSFSVRQSSGTLPAISPTLAGTTGTGTAFTFANPNSTADATYTFEVKATLGTRVVINTVDVLVRGNPPAQATVVMPANICARGSRLCPIIPDSVEDCGATGGYWMVSVFDDDQGSRTLEKRCVTQQVCKSMWWDQTSDNNGGCMSIIQNQEAPNGQAVACHYCVSYTDAVKNGPWDASRTDGIWPAIDDLGLFP